MSKQELIIEAINIMTQIDKLKHDTTHPKTLKMAVYKLYAQELKSIKEKLDKYEKN